VHSVHSARPSEPTIASLRDSSGAAAGESLARYWTFYRAVADAQLSRWLPRRPSRVLDISGGHGRTAGRAAGPGNRRGRSGVAPSHSEQHGGASR
jgi:hypothetical protein